MEVHYFDTLQQAKKSYSRALEPICRRWNLTRNELDVLLFLANNPGFDRAADIVSMRGMTKSHVSLSVSNLEQRGLVQRQVDPADRRTVRIRLTEAAAEPVQAGREAQDRYFRRVFQGITREELAVWKKLVLKAQENIAGMED